MKEHDAVIIGAGAAGLAAAWELSQAGRSAVIIEARQRIGERVYTLHDRGSPIPTELGAELVVTIPLGVWKAGKRAARELLRELRP